MNKLSSILGAAAVIAIAIVFVVQFQPANRSQQVDSGPRCVAEVKGSCIESTYHLAAQSLINSRGMDMARQRAMGFRKLVAEGLVEAWVLNQDAKRLGLTVSDDDVSAEIAAGRAHISLPADKAREVGYSLGLGEEQLAQLLVKDRKTKKFDAKTAEKYIRQRTRMSAAEFRDYQKSELIASRMRDLIKSRVRISDNEAFEQFSREKSTATLDFVRIDKHFLTDLVIDASPRAVEDWADKNRTDLDKAWESSKSRFMPECRVTRHILVKMAETASDDEKAAARKKIERALDRVRKGEDFADVARAMSDDGSASRGGELGCASKGQMVKPFEDAMFSLEEGKVSGVVESQFGFHILKVDKIAKDIDAEKAGKHQIAAERYIGFEADRLAGEGAKKILEAVRGGKSLKDAVDAWVAELPVKKVDDKKKTDDKKTDDKKTDEEADRAPVTVENHPERPTIEATMPFPASGDPIHGVRPGTDLTKIAFDLAKPGDVPGDIVPLENGYAVIQLKAKTPASKEDFEKSREYYVGAIRANKQNDAVVAYVKRLRSVLAPEVKYPNPELVTEPKPGKDDQAPEEMPGDE